jgi:hypothetical protein
MSDDNTPDNDMSASDGEQQLLLDPPWRQTCADIVANFQIGDIVPHAWLHESLGIEFPNTGTRKQFEKLQFDLLSAVEKIREEMLKKHSIYLKNIIRVGYQLSPPWQQTEDAIADYKRGLQRLIGTTAMRLKYVRREQLTDEQARANTDAAATLGSIAAFNNRQIAELKKIPKE